METKRIMVFPFNIGSNGFRNSHLASRNSQFAYIIIVTAFILCKHDANGEYVLHFVLIFFICCSLIWCSRIICTCSCESMSLILFIWTFSIVKKPGIAVRNIDNIENYIAASDYMRIRILCARNLKWEIRNYVFVLISDHQQL